MRFYFLSQVDKSKVTFIDHLNTFLASRNPSEAAALSRHGGQKAFASSLGSPPHQSPSGAASASIKYSPSSASVKSTGSNGTKLGSPSAGGHGSKDCINRVKVEITCCEVPIGFLWVIYNDFNPHMEPDLLVDGFLANLDYNAAYLSSSREFIHLLKMLATDYSRQQLRSLLNNSSIFSSSFSDNQSADISNLYQQLQSVYMRDDISFEFLWRDETLTLYLPLTVALANNGEKRESSGEGATNEGTAFLILRWILNASADNGAEIDHFDSTIQWPNNTPVLTQIPDLKLSSTSILEYHAKLQWQISGKQSKLMSTRSQRQQLFSKIQATFRKYLLDGDSESATFLSLYIFLTAGEEILGASTVNFHFGKYPEELPTCVLSSVLYFDGIDSHKPASKLFYWGDVSASEASVDDIVDRLEKDLVNQIVTFQTYLLEQAGRAGN